MTRMGAPYVDRIAGSHRSLDKYNRMVARISVPPSSMKIENLEENLVPALELLLSASPSPQEIKPEVIELAATLIHIFERTLIVGSKYRHFGIRVMFSMFRMFVRGRSNIEAIQKEQQNP